ncbi:hypothetical protein DPX16_1413 [Anabarilius grahami]|uniref:Immunoglobulin domain-containing protein n=1 Tax=Anabarilius grahami TaxID=495550 RepID=A0A3N0XD49_ANAGA|nr:hypothetical protein DPX16_1413 [Anabarilius grahami]
MFSCDVCDGQRSSLIVQLQFVTESPIICGEDSSSSTDFSYQRVFSAKFPQYVVIFRYFSNICVFGAEEITVPVMEGDSVTLHTGVKTNQQDRIRWYFNDIRIAQITGNLSKTCADKQCGKRFRNRLKLDHQTGSLTITTIKTSDTGLYKLKILGSSSSEKIFNVTVHGE